MWCDDVLGETQPVHDRVGCSAEMTQGRKLRPAGTLVETNVHPPSTGHLLTDVIFWLGSVFSRSKQVRIAARVIRRLSSESLSSLLDIHLSHPF